METISGKADWRRYWGSWLLRKKFGRDVWSNVLFDGLTFKYARFDECAWRSCRFKDCAIGDSTEFRGCLWEHCTYSGKYSSMGGARFFDCEFRNVEIQSALMHGLRFSNCTFSGRFANLIFVGKNADKNDWATTFENCDLSEVELDNVSFVSGVDLGTVKLPKRGARFFSNRGDAFTQALAQAARQLEGDDAIPFKVMEQTTKGQELVIQDTPVFEHLFKGLSAARAAFESLAGAFEISG